MKGWQAIVLCGASATVVVAGSCLPDVSVQGPTAALPCGDGVVDLQAGEECDPGPDAGEAGVPGCGGDCRARCAGVLEATTKHCYFVGSATPRVQSGRDGCAQANGAHLVTFASLDELTFVDKRLFADSGITVGWINLDRQDVDGSARWHPDIAEPGWSGACPGCFAKVTAEAGAFPSYDGGPGGSCVFFLRAYPYTWFAAPCDLGGLLSLSSVCEREPLGSFARPCDGGVCIAVPKTAFDRSYLYSSTPRSWSDAASTCAAISGPLGPGKLLVMRSPEEREEVAHAVMAAKGQSFWVGLSRSGADWTWADGKSLASLVYPIPWGDNAPEPTGTAATLEIDPTRYDVTLAHASDATTPRPFVCAFDLR